MAYLTKAQEKTLKRQVLKYARETGDKELAKKVNEKVDEIVAFYAENGRELTLPEFRKLLEK